VNTDEAIKFGKSWLIDKRIFPYESKEREFIEMAIECIDRVSVFERENSELRKRLEKEYKLGYEDGFHQRKYKDEEFEQFVRDYEQGR